MSKELTINLDDELYAGLMNLVGEQKVSQFIESVLRRHLKKDSSEIYDVELPVAPKIHSPRLADRLKIEIVKELEAEALLIPNPSKLTKEDISDIRAVRRARKGELVAWEEAKAFLNTLD